MPDESARSRTAFSPTGWIAVFEDGSRVNVQAWHHANGAALLVDAKNGRLVQAAPLPGFVTLSRGTPNQEHL